MQEGDIPVFMVYDQSENAFYDAQVLGNDGYNFAALDFPWSPNGVQLMKKYLLDMIVIRFGWTCIY